MSMKSLGRALASLGLVAVLSAGSLVIVEAAANGAPRLDPTNGSTGTVYDVVMSGASISMDPSQSSSSFTYRGTMRIFQDQGDSELSAELELDLNNDSIIDRVLQCSGFVGMSRFGMRCSEDDGLNDIKLNFNGKAVTLDNGLLALRKTSGRGFTDSAMLRFGLQATQQ